MPRAGKPLEPGEAMLISLHDVDSSCSESELSQRQRRLRHDQEAIGPSEQMHQLPPDHIAELPGSSPPCINDDRQTLLPTRYQPPLPPPPPPQPARALRYEARREQDAIMPTPLHPRYNASASRHAQQAPSELEAPAVTPVPAVHLVPPTPPPQRDMGTPPPLRRGGPHTREHDRSHLSPGPSRPPHGSQPAMRSHRPPPSPHRPAAAASPRSQQTGLSVQQPTSPSRRSSRARTTLRDRVNRLSSQMDSTPGDMIWPGPALVDARRANGVSVASRTLGQVDRPKPPLPPPPNFDDGAADASYFDTESLDDTRPPDGGRYAWLVACCGFFVTFNTWGLNTAFGVFQAYYALVLLPERSAAAISWIGSLQLFLLFFLGTPIGLAMDRGWFRVFFNGGSALLLAGLFATSACTEYWHFVVVQGVVTGLGMGMLFCSGVIVLMSYFERNVGKAMALGALGSSVGAIVYALVFQQLVARVSFAWTTRAMALVALATLAAPNAVVRPRAGAPRAPRRVELRAFADAAYLVMAAGFFFAFWGLYFAVYYMVLYSMTQLRLPGTQAVNLLIAMAAANLVGRLLPGVVSDACTGPLNLVIPSCVLSAMFSVVWIWSTSEAALFATAVFYGFASAGIQALYSPTLHSFSHAEPRTMGQKSGFVFTVISIACLTGAPLGGRLIAAGNGSYLGAQLFSGLSMLVAAALLLLSRWMRVGWAGQRV